jgi:hypothetical protein
METRDHPTYRRMTKWGIVFFAANVFGSVALYFWRGRSELGDTWLMLSIIGSAAWSTFRLCVCRCPTCGKWLGADEFHWAPEAFTCRDCDIRWSVTRPSL